MVNKNKINISKEQREQCHVIIHGASVAAGGVGTGLAQIPLADNAVITPIQISMIIALGKVFDQKISKSVATAILGGMAASLIGRGASQILVGWIPLVGNTVNTATAAIVTETIGWTVVDNFSKNQYDNLIEKEENNTDIIQLEEQSEYYDLEKRVEEFISGNKNKRDDKEEFEQLLGELEYKLEREPDNQSIKILYDKL